MQHMDLKSLPNKTLAIIMGGGLIGAALSAGSEPRSWLQALVELAQDVV